jgi:hypothetical protein
VDVEDVQPVVEIDTKLSGFDSAQVAVGRRDHLHVYLDRTRAAEADELALLQHAQELRLRRGVSDESINTFNGNDETRSTFVSCDHTTCTTPHTLRASTFT